MHQYPNERHTIQSVLETAGENRINKVPFQFQGEEYTAWIKQRKVTPKRLFDKLRRENRAAARNLTNVLISFTWYHRSV